MQVHGRLEQQGEIESYEPIALELTGEVSS